jgi:hypothetical protein
MQEIVTYNRDELVSRVCLTDLTASGITTFKINPFSALKDQIFELSTLEKNWDGYDGEPLLEEIKEISLMLITMFDGDDLEKISDLFLNPNGTITFEWVNIKGYKLSLEIGENNYSYFIDYNNNTPKLINGHDILVDIKKIKSEIEQLFSPNLSD